MALGAMAALGPGATVIAAEDKADAQLSEIVLALDAEVFGAFNDCSEPRQLQRHASYFHPDVEFYHDTGGVTRSREEMLANTEKYVCGNFRRELIPGTFEVFRIKEFGAIAQGEHRFCQFDSGQCEGIARFVIIWRHADGKWLITRVLSYGHRPNDVSSPDSPGISGPLPGTGERPSG